MSSASGNNLLKFRCLPYTEKVNGEYFFVRGGDDGEAITFAQEEAKASGFKSVFVETDQGRQVYDGPVETEEIFRVDYTITGTMSFPNGTTFVEGRQNQLLLPSGQVVSIHPVIEVASGPDADDHRNLSSYREAEVLGIIWGDYDRTIEEANEILG